MDWPDGELFKLVVSAASITYSIVFGVIAKKVWDVPKTIQTFLEEYSVKMDARLARLDEESKMSHRRLNVQDRITSKLSGKDFDSRAIAESGVYPDIRTMRKPADV